MTTAAAPPAESGLQTTQPKAIKPIEDVRATLERLKPQLLLALPKHLTPERLCRVAMTAIQNTPALLNCDRTSLFAAIFTCAQLGLEPDGVLGQAYLVPFKGKVQFIPGYRGLLSLARNSGEVRSIQAQEVCAKDRFEYAYGLDPKLVHVPATGERGEVVAFYAVAHFVNGGSHFEVMTRAQVEAIRDKSQGYVAFKAGKIKETPWESNFVEMGRKTAIRRIAKYLPMNVQKAAAIADAFDSGRHAELGELGELVVDTPAEDLSAGAIDVSPSSGPSKLDQFAGSGEAEPATEAGADAETGEPRTSDVEPKLLSPARVDQLREMAIDKGLDADEIAANVAGCGLAKMPATFETTYLRKLSDSKPARGRR